MSNGLQFQRLLALAAVVGVVASTGCVKRTATKATVAKQDDGGSERLFNSVVGMLEGSPGRNLYPTITEQFNQYFNGLDESESTLSDEQQQKLSKLLGSEALPELQAGELTHISVDYMVSSMMFKKIHQSLRDASLSDIEYATRLFEWVVRYVQVIPLGGETPEGPPMEVCIRGTGDYMERCAVFLELLRQAGLDGCIVAFQSEKGVVPWLCGVMLRGKVYVFHPEIGLPLTNADGSPATTDDLVAHPEILQSLAPDSSVHHAVAPPNYSKLTLLLALEPSMVLPQMKRIETHLAGERRVNLYVDVDALVASAGEAVKNSDAVKEVRVTRRFADIRRRFFTDSAYRLQLLLSIGAHWLRSSSTARHLQILGRHEDAIRQFVKLDMEFRPELLNEDLKRSGIEMSAAQRGDMVSRTRQDILYFGGVSQLDVPNPNYTVARAWFDRYLKDYGSPLLREGDILAWGALCEQLSNAGESDEPTAARRFWELLPVDAQKVVRDVVTNYGPLREREFRLMEFKREVQKMAELRAEFGATEEIQREFKKAAELLRLMGEQQQEALRLDLQSRKALVAAVNELLKRKDFYSPKYFQAVASNPSSSSRHALLAEDPDKLSQLQIITRNRYLFNTTFSEHVSRGVNQWVPGALRHKALALKAEGKVPQAVSLLNDPPVELPDLYKACFQALAKSWQRDVVAAR